MTDEPYLPLPPLDADSQPFLEAAERGEFIVQSCADCGALRFPPRLRCPNCLSDAAEWQPSQGRGHVYSFVVVHQRTGTALDAELPYVSALVELEEGPRMLAMLVDCPREEVRVGMPVRVVFERTKIGAAVPRVRPDR